MRRPATGTRWGGAARRTLPALAGAALLITVWWIAAAADLVNERLFPGPLESFQAIGAGLADESLLTDLRATVARMATALGLAIGIGVPLGILLGANRTVYRCLEFPIDFFRSTPVTAVFPFFLLMFGIGDEAKVALGAFAAGLLILFNVAYGVMAARPTRKMAAQVMGAGRLRTLCTVTVFEALPQTFVGLRTGSSLALVCIVVAEMFIGADAGIGHRIIDAQQTYNLADMYGSIIIAGVLGFMTNALFHKLDTSLVHWTGR
ncbi:ABC transporter permease [Actinomadura sp. WMMB 499]|uniref:ABC transporter permease n=1 Tax=Actinomadura sp. WMMB 499 TaxID=1219491 RepID=UPI001247CCFB|nr:ABC transporter permease [Actinomadura sp. WMMB 499]QFG22584.1 ABC transporter permease [Actinomadura sp. WMMB 499]